MHTGLLHQPVTESVPENSAHQPGPLWIRVLFWACIGLHLLPLVLFIYLPLADGPAHVYNADIVRRVLTGGEMPVVLDWNPVPVPNWLTHVLLALFLNAASGPGAERLVIAGYILLLPLAFRYSLRAFSRDTQGWELSIFPFLYTSHLHWGFYNFCYSLAIYLFLLGYWLRHRMAMTPSRTGVLALLALLLYFSHPVSLIEGILLIAAFSAWDLFALRNRAILRHLASASLAFIPAVALYFWFSTQRLNAGEGVTEWPTLSYAASNLLRLLPLKTFFRSELLLAAGFALVLAGACAVTAYLRLRRRMWSEAGLLLAALVQAAIVFAAPVTAGGGTMITPRLIYFPVFTFVWWMAGVSSTAPLRSRLRTDTVIGDMGAVVGGIGVLTAVGLLALHIPAYQAYDSRMEKIVESIPPLPQGSTIAFLTSKPTTPLTVEGTVPELSLSAGAYIAVRDRLIYVNNYEAATDHFPLVFRKGKDPYKYLDGAGRIALAAYSNASGIPVNYVLLWGDAPELDSRYEEVPLASHNIPLRLLRQAAPR